MSSTLVPDRAAMDMEPRTSCDGLSANSISTSLSLNGLLASTFEGCGFANPCLIQGLLSAWSFLSAHFHSYDKAEMSMFAILG